MSSLNQGEQGFEIFYKFLGWNCISLGIHFDPLGPLLDIHIPSGWIRIGYKSKAKYPSIHTFEDGLYRLK